MVKNISRLIYKTRFRVLGTLRSSFKLIGPACVFLSILGCATTSTTPESTGPNGVQARAGNNLDGAPQLPPTESAKQEGTKQEGARQKEQWYECAQLIVNGDLEAFKKQEEICLSVRSLSGMTPLMFAIYKQQDPFFDYLIARIDVHAVDFNGDNALFYAVMAQRADYIERLRGVDARIQLNDLQVSPLWIAIQNAPAEVVFALRPNWIEVNLRGTDGWSALYFAIRRKEPSVFDFILNSPSEVDIRDSENLSPLEFARDEVGWDHAVQTLQRFLRNK